MNTTQTTDKNKCLLLRSGMREAVETTIQAISFTWVHILILLSKPLIQRLKITLMLLTLTACFKHPLAFGGLTPGSTMTQCTYNKCSRPWKWEKNWTPRQCELFGEMTKARKAVLYLWLMKYMDLMEPVWLSWDRLLVRLNNDEVKCVKLLCTGPGWAGC